jgi:hypothetical protein
MLGQIEEWFYHDLAGIRSEGDGFKTIGINPQPVGDIIWARASYQSIRGLIVSDWKRSGSTFTLKVTIPANTTANIYLPAKTASDVIKFDKAEFLRVENGRAVYAVGSGEYTFESKDL